MRAAPSSSRSDDLWAAFRVEVRDEGGVTHVVPVGELDVATVGRVDERLRQLEASGPCHVVLDLRGLTFMDSTGLHLALAWHERARRNGMELEVVKGPPAVHRVFELAGVADRLPLRDDLP